MLENQDIRPAAVIGPYGQRLTLADLPPPGIARWVSRRKAEAVTAVAGGLLTAEEACQRYALTLEELASWQRGYARAGARALRVTHIQAHREQFGR